MWPFKKRDCATQGHRMRKETRTGYSMGDYHSNCVADNVEQEREICRDCDATWGWRTTYSSCLQGLSIDTRRYRELEKTGFIQT